MATGKRRWSLGCHTIEGRRHSAKWLEARPAVAPTIEIRARYATLTMPISSPTMGRERAPQDGRGLPVLKKDWLALLSGGAAKLAELRCGYSQPKCATTACEAGGVSRG